MQLDVNAALRSRRVDTSERHEAGARKRYESDLQRGSFSIFSGARAEAFGTVTPLVLTLVGECEEAARPEQSDPTRDCREPFLRTRAQRPRSGSSSVGSAKSGSPEPFSHKERIRLRTMPLPESANGSSKHCRKACRRRSRAACMCGCCNSDHRKSRDNDQP